MNKGQGGDSFDHGCLWVMATIMLLAAIQLAEAVKEMNKRNREAGR